MQEIVVAKPYRFVPPVRSRLWNPFLCWWVPRMVRKTWGVEAPTFSGLERMRASLDAGDGILVAPNHCRPCDPPVVGLVHIRLRVPCFIMASWHLFMQSRMQRFLMRRAGAFSVYREGVDREALRMATQILVSSERPLVMFAEGIVSRSNDRLGELMEGTTFIARAAAKERVRAGRAGRVVIHPVALRYTFHGDLRKSIEPVLTKIETRLSWRPQRDLPILERVKKLGEGLLSVKEVEYVGAAQDGSMATRLPRLIDAVLKPLEDVYLNGNSDASTIERVKKLRAAILPALIRGDLSQEETARRWRHLADCYFAQQLACYPIDYLNAEPSVERILETVERYEEDLTDQATIHRPLHCHIEVGEAIPVSPERTRGSDPILTELRAQLEKMLAESAALCHPWRETA